MTKRLDPDVKALGAGIRALNMSSSRRMLIANLRFLWDRFIERPGPSLPVHLQRGKP